MFTGLVREVGDVVSFEDGRLVVECGTAAELGDSVAIAGVCLTVVDNGDGTPRVRRRAGDARARQAVRRARQRRAGAPCGRSARRPPGAGPRRRRRQRSPRSSRTATAFASGSRRRAELLRYCVEKGSITVDGVSLTVAAVDETAFEVALIPHTLAETTLSLLATGDNVNLETDVLAKYVEKLLPDTMRR